MLEQLNLEALATRLHWVTLNSLNYIPSLVRKEQLGWSKLIGILKCGGRSRLYGGSISCATLWLIQLYLDMFEDGVSSITKLMKLLLCDTRLLLLPARLHNTQRSPVGSLVHSA